MKICYLCSDPEISLSGQTGPGAQIRCFVGALRKLDHEVALLGAAVAGYAPQDVAVFGIPQTTLFDDLTVAYHMPALRAVRHVCNNTMTEQSLRQILTFFQPDLIYERHSPFSFVGGVVAEQAGVPHMLEVNGPLCEQLALEGRPALRDAREALELAAFEHTNLILATDPAIQVKLVAAGVPPARVADMPARIERIVELAQRIPIPWRRGASAPSERRSA